MSQFGVPGPLGSIVGVCQIILCGGEVDSVMDGSMRDLSSK